MTNTKMPRTRVLAFSLFALAGLLAGCQYAQPIAYEERYRIFQAIELGGTIRPTDSPDEIARKFAPTAAVNAAIEGLAQEGFVLSKMEPLPTDAGATLFTFRREIPEGYRPTRAPMEFTGLFVVGEENPETVTYYVLTPRFAGYILHTLGAEGYHTYEADWNGRELRWDTGSQVNTVVLTDNGLQLIRTSVDVGSGQRRTIVARRVRSLD